MKKILASLLMVILVGSLTATATKAAFSDTETSVGNTFSTGTIDLKVDGNDDPEVVSINLDGLKPGDGTGVNEHSTIQHQWILCNTGTVDGRPSIEFTNLQDKDNGCNDSETAAGDTSCQADTGGELSQNLFIKVNAPGSTGFVYPNRPGCTDSGSQCPLSTWAGLGVIGKAAPWEIWQTIPAGQCTAPMVLEAEIPESVGNIIQSDSSIFDIVFHLDQVTP